MHTRRSARSAAVAGLVLGSLCFGAPAWAETAQEQALAVSAAGWTWSPPAGAPIPASAAAPAGDLAVGYAGDPAGAPSAKTYLAFDLSTLPTGSAVTSLTLRLTLDPAAHNVQPADSALVACLPAAGWTAAEGAPAATAPTDDCTVSAVGRLDAAGTGYDFELGLLADAWQETGPERGVVIRPSLGYVAPDGTPFQLSFTGPATVVAVATYVPPATVTTPGAGAPDPYVPQPVVAPPPMPVGGLVGGGSPTLPTPDLAPAPAVAPPPAAAPAVDPRAAALALRAEIRRDQAAQAVPPTGFWLAVGAAALLLLVISAVAADTRSAPAALRAGARRRAVAAALVAQAGSARTFAPVAAGPRGVRLRLPQPTGTAGTAADLG